MVASQPPQSVDNLVDLLCWRGEISPSDRGFRFLENGEGEGEFCSFEELDRRARAIGARLEEVVAPGDRVLLLFGPSLEYVEAFFGCLYAGAIAVPAYPPNPARLNRTLPRLQAIVADAEATAVVSTEMIVSMSAMLGAQAPELGALTWVATDVVPDERASEWSGRRPGREEIAFLQYTSGSTGRPKGVVLDHATLMRNEELIYEAFEYGSDDVTLSWLPLYHDMGLIGGVIQPVYSGGQAVLMSPLDFLKKPQRWVEAISRFGATASGGPNFAFDLAVRKTPEEVRDGLDLSTWKVACNGAEPVRSATMERFLAYFGQAGVSETLFQPSYGLAEVGLIVSATRFGEKFRVFEAGEKEHVSCGPALGDFEMLIVDADGECVKEGEVGEIWLRYGSVARGYWKKEAVNEEVFQAKLKNGEGPYLRTGDLGFLKDGELVVTGRMKDLIVIRGANHYPQDIEATVEGVDGAVRRSCGAAFGVDVEGEEHLVVVVEVDEEKMGTAGGLIHRIEAAIAREHDLATYEVVLIKARTIEKTSSGKIQRFAARKAYLADELEVVGRSSEVAESDEVSSGAGASESEETGAPDEVTRKEEEIRAWLQARVAEVAGIEKAEVGLNRPFSVYGIDSATAVGIVGELEEVLGRRIEATALYDFPTIDALARHLGGGERKVKEAARASASERRDRSGAMAIVGMGCRFPGAEGVGALLELLESGESALSKVPADRWDGDGFVDPEVMGFDVMASDQGGFLEDIRGFDAAFFEISPREARAMDPQQRLVMETAWAALVDAGLDKEALEGSRTGVFLGQSGSDFARLYKGAAVRAGTGVAAAVTANRLSYWLNLKGPSLVVDTACSSSLAALDQAVLQLRAGRCEQAIVGGVNVMLAPDASMAFSQAGMLARSGELRAFDKDANGYVRGEGCGVVVIKPLEAARRDGDKIWAVIAGGALNQDGATNGLTAPSGPAQQDVIRAALEDAGMGVELIEAIEAHGTGTELGDAIEARALGAVFKERAESGERVWLGSVKAQVGHLEAGAGMAGLIKAALMVNQRRVFKQANFEVPNPACELEGSALEVATEMAPMLGAVGVSSFGFGGTNAHFVVESAAPEKKVAFAFTGQGSQSPSMGLKLRATWPGFRRVFDEVLEVIGEVGGPDLLAMLEAGDEGIHSTGNAQPVIFAFEVALARMLMAAGVKPALMMGHSVGEIAAAYIGGALSLRDAARLVVVRGAEMEKLEVSGAMAAVFAAPEEVEALIASEGRALEIAVYNGDRHVVVAGRSEEVEDFVEAIDREGIYAVALKVSHGFHSRLMEPMLGPFEEALEGIEFGRLKIEMLSAVQAQKLGADGLDKAYFVEHVRRPVRFVETADLLEKEGIEAVVEIGPKEVLAALGKRLKRGPRWTAVVKSGQEEAEDVKEAVGALLREWSEVARPEGPVFERKEYWPASGELRELKPGVDE